MDKILSSVAEGTIAGVFFLFYCFYIYFLLVLIAVDVVFSIHLAVSFFSDNRLKQRLSRWLLFALFAVGLPCLLFLFEMQRKPFPKQPDLNCQSCLQAPVDKLLRKK